MPNVTALVVNGKRWEYQPAGHTVNAPAIWRDVIGGKHAPFDLHCALDALAAQETLTEKAEAENARLMALVEEESDTDRSLLNALILETICRLPDEITEGDWSKYLDENRDQWLSEYRAFGGWLTGRIRDVVAARARSQNGRLVNMLVECIDSLEYVESTFPLLTGYGVRQSRILRAKGLLATEGTDVP